ncbi:hypothetical protein JYT53_00625 [Cytophagaceae bacterium AH-315-L13]|nr:hypothetical protein [Cytophagaceae bacterium AH-315-L13]
MRVLVFTLISVLSFLYNITVYGQGCCSGGTPILSSLELPATGSKQIQLALTYDRNTMNTLFENTQKIEDDLRKRLVNSYMLESSYGINSFLSVTGFFSYIFQQRNIKSIATEKNNITTSYGIGDAVILLKYNLETIKNGNQRIIALGAGPKIPLGKSTITENGILLPADLQPGTGVWDVIGWGYLSRSLLPINIFTTFSYRKTGANNRYKQSGYDLEYKFGNELILKLGASYRTQTILDYSFVFKYRSTTADKVSDVLIPNTGVSWLSFIPGINLKVIDNVALRLSAELPVYRKLAGTQLTTTYKALFSIFYNLNNTLQKYIGQEEQL